MRPKATCQTYFRADIISLCFPCSNRERRGNFREKQRRSEEEKRDRLKTGVEWRKETRKILVMDDHRQQAERFLQLIGEQTKTDILDTLQDEVRIRYTSIDSFGFGCMTVQN